MYKKLLLLFILLTVLPAACAEYYSVQKTTQLKREKGKDYNLELHNKTNNKYLVSFIYKNNGIHQEEPHEEVDPNGFIRIAGFKIKKAIGVGIYTKGLQPVAGFYIAPNDEREALYLKLKSSKLGSLILKPQTGKDFGSKSGRSLFKNVKEHEIKKIKEK